VKTYVLKERNVSLIHLYAGFAICCDGEKTLRVPLTNEQIVQLASDACEQAAKILRWEKDQCAQESPSKDSPGSTPEKK
jgi:hypothetical protein